MKVNLLYKCHGSISGSVCIFLWILLLLLQACNDLEVANLNDPDYNSVFSSPGKAEEVTGELIHDWFMTAHGYMGLASVLLVAADAATCSWSQWYWFGKEPREIWDNSPSGNLVSFSHSYYQSFYAVLGHANDIIRLTGKPGDTLQNHEILRAIGYFTQGIGLGYVGLLYDKGFVVTHETDLEKVPEPRSYKELVTEAVRSLNKTIAICRSVPFTIPDGWIPGDKWNNEDLARLASSFAARLLVYSARNKTEDDATDWAAVYEYARNGIRKDFAPMADNVKWHSDYHLYSSFTGWLLTDLYVVHLMDPNMPARFPASGLFSDLPGNGRATSEDARLESDFQFVSSCPFRAERGYYHFSSYRYKRLDIYLTTRKGPMPEFRTAENALLLAEAAARTGKIEEAAFVMNTSPRITRGKLPPLPPNREKILGAIHYERMVELMSSGACIQYFQMRKEEKLQKGTLLHFPIPGPELQITGMDYYTFGGTTGIPGVDISNGGW
jgi:hypothetical protein